MPGEKGTCNKTALSGI